MRTKGTNKRSNTYVRNRMKRKLTLESDNLKQTSKKGKRAIRPLLKTRKIGNPTRDCSMVYRSVLRFGSINVDGINESSRQHVETMLYEKKFDVS